MNRLLSEIPYIEGDRLILKEVKDGDSDSLLELVRNPKVYKYLPSGLFERKYDDIHCVIDKLYDMNTRESIILGIFYNGEFCGLMELYGYNEITHKISVGYRLSERFWGQGIATEALKSVTSYLFDKTDIEIITASTMIGNHASEKVLHKNYFFLIAENVNENWGYKHFTVTNKWIRHRI